VDDQKLPDQLAQVNHPVVQNRNGDRLVVAKLSLIRNRLINLRETAVLAEFELDLLTMLAQAAAACGNGNRTQSTASQNALASAAQT